MEGSPEERWGVALPRERNCFLELRDGSGYEYSQHGTGEHLGFEQPVSRLLASVSTMKMERSRGCWAQDRREDRESEAVCERSLRDRRTQRELVSVA